MLQRRSRPLLQVCKNNYRTTDSPHLYSLHVMLYHVSRMLAGCYYCCSCPVDGVAETLSAAAPTSGNTFTCRDMQYRASYGSIVEAADARARQARKTPRKRGEPVTPAGWASPSSYHTYNPKNPEKQLHRGLGNLDHAILFAWREATKACPAAPGCLKQLWYKVRYQ